MKNSIALLLLFSPLFSFAQEISGKIMDEDKEIVFAANIFFASDPNSGVVSDMEACFSIPYTYDSDTLIVSFIGYMDKKILAIDLSKENNLIILKKEAITLDEIVVQGSTPISEQFSTEKISSLDIYMNPISQGDPLKAIINMPASTNSDESANPALRGSSSNRSRVIYNGVPIYNPVKASSLNNVGFFSIFNPAMIDVQTVYPSNPPLTNGNASGGIVDINTIRSIDKNKYQASGGVGNVGVAISQQLKAKTSFIQAYGNWQNSALLKEINGNSLPDMKKYDTKDAGLNLRIKIDKNIYLNSFNYFMKEKYEGTSEMLAYQGDILSAGLRYFSINNLNIYSTIGTFTFNYGYNYEKKDLLFGNNKVDSKDYAHFSSLNYKKEIFNNVMLQSGVTLDIQRTAVDNIVPQYYYAMHKESPTYNQDTTVSNWIAEPYMYINWDINTKTSVSAGARTNIPIENQKQYLSAQYSLKYTPARNHTVIFSAGQYHNYTLPDYYNVMYSLLSSRQISVDYTYLNKTTKIQTALYFKDEKGEQAVDFFYNINKTKTFGFEVSVAQKIGKDFTLSLSNSMIKQDMYVNNMKYKGAYNYLYFLKPSITYSNPKILSVGLSYIGRPGSHVLNYPVNSSKWNESANTYEPIYSGLEQAQRGAYNRLDLSMSKHMNLKKCAVTVYVSVNNILNTENETNGIYYNTDYSQTYDKYHSLRVFYAGLVIGF